MSIPKIEVMVSPILKEMARANGLRVDQIIEFVRKEFNITVAEENQYLPDGSEKVLHNSLRRLISFLLKEELIRRRSGKYEVTAKGLRLAENTPAGIAQIYPEICQNAIIQERPQRVLDHSEANCEKSRISNREELLERIDAAEKEKLDLIAKIQQEISSLRNLRMSMQAIHPDNYALAPYPYLTDPKSKALQYILKQNNVRVLSDIVNLPCDAISEGLLAFLSQFKTSKFAAITEYLCRHEDIQKILRRIPLAGTMKEWLDLRSSHKNNLKALSPLTYIEAYCGSNVNQYEYARKALGEYADLILFILESPVLPATRAKEMIIESKSVEPAQMETDATLMEVVADVIRHLFYRNKQVRQLMLEPKWSSKIFGIGGPILLRAGRSSQGKHKDYWQKPLLLQGEKYLLYMRWTLNSLSKLQKYAGAASGDKLQAEIMKLWANDTSPQKLSLSKTEKPVVQENTLQAEKPVEVSKAKKVAVSDGNEVMDSQEVRKYLYSIINQAADKAKLISVLTLSGAFRDALDFEDSILLDYASAARLRKEKKLLGNYNGLIVFNMRTYYVKEMSRRVFEKLRAILDECFAKPEESILTLDDKNASATKRQSADDGIAVRSANDVLGYRPAQPRDIRTKIEADAKPSDRKALSTPRQTFLAMDDCDIAELTTALETELSANGGYANVVKLYQQIRWKMITFLEDNDIQDAEGLGRLLQSLFGSKYHFSLPHIFTQRQRSLSPDQQLVAMFAPQDKPFSRTELKDELERRLGGDLSPAQYYKMLDYCKQCIQLNEDEHIHPNAMNLSSRAILAINKELYREIQQNGFAYTCTFVQSSMLPIIEYPWTDFLLRDVVTNFLTQYRVIHAGNSRELRSGEAAIVLRSSTSKVISDWKGVVKNVVYAQYDGEKNLIAFSAWLKKMGYQSQLLKDAQNEFSNNF